MTCTGRSGEGRALDDFLPVLPPAVGVVAGHREGGRTAGAFSASGLLARCTGVCSGGCGVRGSDLWRLEADRETRSEKCAAGRITPSVRVSCKANFGKRKVGPIASSIDKRPPTEFQFQTVTPVRGGHFSVTPSQGGHHVGNGPIGYVCAARCPRLVSSFTPSAHNGSVVRTLVLARGRAGASSRTVCPATMAAGRMTVTGASRLAPFAKGVTRSVRASAGWAHSRCGSHRSLVFPRSDRTTAPTTPHPPRLPRSGQRHHRRHGRLQAGVRERYVAATHARTSLRCFLENALSTRRCSKSIASRVITG